MNEDQPSKGGRPPKPDDEKRSKTVTVKLTEAEYKEVKKRADAAGVNLSEYVRHGSFRLTIVSRLNEEEKKIAQGILHLGSDFNQALRWMNTIQSRVAAQKLHKIVDGMFEILGQLRPKQETEYVGTTP
ncbi:MAG: hypothetical protein NC453_22275 [Muribaculum sp.]|nr:hypothetical protein [Muribaculum sp.]